MQRLSARVLLWRQNFTTTAKDLRMEGPLQKQITEKLSKKLEPSFLQVVNESPNHNVPGGSESHFRVLVVSTLFNGQTPIKRHRLVNDALKEELAGAIHALTIQAKTPAQWDSSTTTHPSPPCEGGHGK